MFRNMFRRSCLVLTLLLSACVFAQDTTDNDDQPEIFVGPLVVTANREALPMEKLGSSVTVITAEEMTQAGHSYVADALRDVPGLDVVRSGGLGKTTSVFMRGANSAHTLVLMDGIELNDPISPGNSFDFAHLSVANIDRIEIVRGPQSTVYGSDALGGVVQIFTRKGEGALKTRLELGGGSYATQQQGVHLSGSQGAWKYNLAAEHFDQDGFSAADEDQGNIEDDPYRNTTLNTNLSYDTGETWSFGIAGRYANVRSHIDNSGGIGGDDPNYLNKGKRTYLRAFARINLDEQRWNQELGVGFSRNDRDLTNGFDADHPESSVDANYQGEKMKVDWRHTLVPSERHTLTFGLESEEEKGNSRYASVSSFGPYLSVFEEQTARTNGVFLQDFWQATEDLALTLGTRYDDHDRFGSRMTYRATGSYQLGEAGTFLKGSFGTGFKSPSLFQLYSSFGSPDLLAEKSEGWDFGVTHAASQLGLSLSVSYFQNDFKELIEYDSDLFSYNNIARAETSGVETNLDWAASSRIDVALQHTYMETEDLETGLQLVRRPKQKAQARLTLNFSGGANVNLFARYTGNRDFTDFSTFPSSRVTLGGFTLLHLSGQLPIGERFNLRARVENVTDKDYVEVLGYGTTGLAGYLNLSYQL